VALREEEVGDDRADLAGAEDDVELFHVPQDEACTGACLAA
jgi:hypothetical protein